MAKTLKEEFLNLPNMLTMLRIVAIPPFIVLCFKGDPMSSYWAALLFSLAAVTDVIDGWLARRQGLVTVMGQFLDPLADKLIVMAALVMMVRLGRVASGLVILLLAREFIINGLRTLAASEGMVIAAGQGGKWKTALQLTSILCLITHYTYELNFGFFKFEANFGRVGTWLIWLSVIPSIWSAIEYFLGFLAVMTGKEERAKAKAKAAAAQA